MNNAEVITTKHLPFAIELGMKTPAMFWGMPGIGKSQKIAQWCKENGKKLYDIRLSQLDHSDLRGIQYMNTSTGKMDWAPPVDLPSQDEKDTVILFDEINSGMPSVMAAMYQIFTDKKVGQHVLPEDTIILGAGNRMSDRGVTYRQPKPISNRLQHWYVEPDYNEWVSWAINSGVHPVILGFLENHKSKLAQFDPTSEDEAFPTPRTWAHASNTMYYCEKNKDVLSESFILAALSGNIGRTTAYELNTHRRLFHKLPNIDDVLNGKVKNLEVDASAMFMFIAMLGEKLREDPSHKNVNNVFTFFLNNCAPEVNIYAGALMFKYQPELNPAFLPTEWTNKYMDLIL